MRNEPKTKINITIYFMNGDELECNGVWSYTLNQVALQLVYENFHVDYPICNIKEISYQYGNLK